MMPKALVPQLKTIQLNLFMASHLVDRLFKENTKVTNMSCLHPVRVKLERGVSYVPCGKCQSCLLQSSTKQQRKCNRLSDQYKYQIFFTLTYDNENIPTPQRICPTFQMLVRGNGEYLRYICNKFNASENEAKNIQHFAHKSYGVLFKRDIQNFVKRVRQRIYRNITLKHLKHDKNYQKSLDEVKFFVVGEYGPTTLRPHYHGLFFTNSREVYNYLFKSIPACWSLCDMSKIDVQAVQASANYYVSAYVNSIHNLPAHLVQSVFKPFRTASKETDYKDTSGLEKMHYDSIINCFPYFYETTKDNVMLRQIPYQTILRWFPRCKGFSNMSISQRLRLFKRYIQYGYAKNNTDVGLGILQRLTEKVFGYQDYNFVQSVLKYTSKPLPYPIRIDGRLTGETGFVKLSPLDYFTLQDELYKRIELNKLANQLSCVNNINRSSLKGKDKFFALYSIYDNFKDYQKNIDYNRFLQLRKLLRPNNVDIHFLYNNYNQLNELEIQFHNHFIYTDFVKELSCKVQDKTKTRKYNEVIRKFNHV